jgi:simple sugar transport system ATP-binding protein
MVDEPQKAAAPDARVIARMTAIVKRFGHVEAVAGCELELRRGEILGLVGDNGAGKSTLVKILGGNLVPDEGEIEIDGAVVQIPTAETARRLGIEMIHQHLALFNSLDVPANIFIGREPTRRLLGIVPFLDRAAMRRRTVELLQRLGVAIPVDARVGGLSGGQRQMTAIARAVAFQASAKIVVMDEPSAALGIAEAATVIELIRSLKRSGHSIIVISHRIPELIELSDRIMIMKAGRRVAVLDSRATSLDEVAGLIVSGRRSSAESRERRRGPAPATSGATPAPGAEPSQYG